ncbi:MAG: DUF4079 domain-containing protein [Cyanobacteriota bacterium]|nr:DUF4079 domain-containing protein [Cyanobacteriota bacterium]
MSSALSLTAMQWFGLLHPVLIILFVYPVVGATIRLGTLARERRLQINPLPASVPVEHAEHGRWVAGGVLVAVLTAFFHSYLAAWFEASPGGLAGVGRLVALAFAELGTVVIYLRLLKVRRPAARALLGLACWLALLLLGAQPEINRLTDNPFDADFWRSHYWSGVLLSGLLIASVAAKPEIARHLSMRRLHVYANVLVAVLLAVQAITGTRNLLAA